MSNCLFCEIANGRTASKENPENVVLFESDNFYVKPALGHFVEGYCLVISKEHLLTMAELTTEEAAELQDILGETALRLNSLYKNGLCTFEHGAACPSNRAGACIDHAHMHILPRKCDVRSQLRLKSEKILDLGGLCDFGKTSQSYIYYEREPGERIVYRCDERVPSQFMRRLICEYLGMDHNWDWRVSPCRESIQEFIARWRSAFPMEAEIRDSVAS